jgi:hypothetical protein
MYQAIQTKFLGPTDCRGSRVKATTESGVSITIDWDHSKNVEENHTAAAFALAAKLGWTGEWVGGAIKAGYAFVSPRGMGDDMPGQFTI